MSANIVVKQPGIDQPFVAQCRKCKRILADSSTMLYMRKGLIVFITAPEVEIEETNIKCKKCKKVVGRYELYDDNILIHRKYQLLLDKLTLNLTHKPKRKRKIKPKEDLEAMKENAEIIDLEMMAL
eukprot:NODE_16_length_49026_cov_1.035992.p24 type:complete len:126 gc:universal NODE_16_length_49026_cov_1.035992:24267-24644(+)